jgi:long-chain acyl-CoA synthetase
MPVAVWCASIARSEGLKPEAVRAYIVPQEDGLTEEAVRAHCKQYLTDYKLPKAIEFRKELPKTPIGKILRKDLRADYKQRSGG